MAEAVRTRKTFKKEKRSKPRSNNPSNVVGHVECHIEEQPSVVQNQDSQRTEVPISCLDSADVTDVFDDLPGTSLVPCPANDSPVLHVKSDQVEETVCCLTDNEELKIASGTSELTMTNVDVDDDNVPDKSVQDLMREFDQSIEAAMQITRNVNSTELSCTSTVSGTVIEDEFVDIHERPPPYCENITDISAPLYTDLRQALNDIQNSDPINTFTFVPQTSPTAPLMVEEEHCKTNEKSLVDVEQDATCSSEVFPKQTEITHRKIHHSKTVVPLEDVPVRPFTEAQLKALYRNVEMEANEQFIQDFISKSLLPENHEFQELVSGYLRSRVALITCAKSFDDLKRDYKRSLDRVWETVEQLAEEKGQCLDKTIVFGRHIYHLAIYNAEGAVELRNILNNIHSTLYEIYALHAYEIEMSRLQVESFLYKLINSIPGVKDIPRNAPIIVDVDGRRPPQLLERIQEIKRCIAILFSVQRKPIKDAQSLQDTRNWLTSLVSIILRLGSFEDHLFLLNHVLRCPAGIGSWATAYIQVPLPHADQGQYSIHGPYLDHILTVLATILLPIRAREEFLQNLKMNESTVSIEAVEEQLWVVVDSEGEEDEDPSNSWLHWRENDLVALINQIPIDSVFRCLLHIQSRDDVDHYNVRCVSDSDIIIVFAFATHLIHLWRMGLKTFHLARYRQFTKRISQLIRHTVLFVSNHWEQFLMSNPELPISIQKRLQAEYDQFFLRAVYSIFYSQSFGAWQFMAAMPYDCVSVEMLWKILWLLHNEYREELDAVENEISAGDWKSKLDDEHLRLTFEEKLSLMPESEAFYLLTAFAQMACSRKSEEREMIETICREIFQIAFLNESTKQLCSKWGRELLFTISIRHPFVMSEILEEVRVHMSKLGKMSIYLFCELPTHLWLPLDVDIDTIVLWLIEYTPSSCENQLAQIILSSMNWDFNKLSDELFMDISIHRRVALAVAQSYRKHLVTPNAGFVSERLKQVSNFAVAAIRNDNDPDETFCSWAWEMVMSLRVHVHQQPPSRLLKCDIDFTAPDISNSRALGELQWSFRQKHPLTMFLAFTITNIGHSVIFFCEKLGYLANLVETQHFEAAVHVLGLVTPFFFNCGHYLYTNKRFLTLLQGILNSDSTYVKMAKSLVSTQFPGRILQCFAGLIEYQVQIANKVGWDLKCVVQFWTELLTSDPLWYKNQSVLYLLDIIFRDSFIEGLNDSKSVLAKKFQNEASSRSSGGGFTSFVYWLATGSGVPFTFAPKNTGSKFVWFSYYALELETESEYQIKLWKNILRQLVANSTITPEASLKKAAGSFEDRLPPPVRHLPIYRWAELALEVPQDHPLLALVWQKFFTLFLQRVPQTARSGSMDCGSVGERFFSNTSDVPLFKKLKKRLYEMTSYFEIAASECVRQGRNSESSAPENDFDAVVHGELDDHNKRVVLYEKLQRLYRTFYLWLEEPRLHDPSPYLPSLPAEYEPSRLLVIFQNDQNPWLEFLNATKIKGERQSLLDIWCGRSLQKYRRPGWKACASHASVTANESGVENMLKRLQSYEAPLSAPCIAPLKCVVPELFEDAFRSRKALLDTTRPHLTALTNYASLFSDRVANHLALDCNYMEQLPQLYCNIETEVRAAKVVYQCCTRLKHLLFEFKVRLKVCCSRSDNVDKGCLGAARICLKFKEKKIIISVEHNLEHNRTEWQIMLNESLIGPPKIVCTGAVFIENAISELLKKRSLAERQNSIQNVVQLTDIGINLFYHLCGLLDSQTELYPPTRQFFTSCVEILGQELVQKEGDQCDRLLRLILSCPRLVGLLAPHFCPSMANANDVLQLYRRVSSVHMESGTDLAFVVLSKFDVQCWLKSKNPRLADREEVVQIIGNVLIDLGREPAPEFLGIHELYRKHLITVLLYRFPDMYRDVFALLFKGVDLRDLSTDVFYDIFNAFVNNGVMEGKDRLSEYSSNEEICLICCGFAQTQQLFSLQQVRDIHAEIRETLVNLGDIFAKKRLCSKESLLPNLYSKCGSYVEPILIFTGLMGHAFVASLKREAPSRALSAAELQDAWKHLQNAFAPWILTVVNNDKLQLPWTVDQQLMAVTAVSLFGSCIQYASAALYATGSIPHLFLEMYAAELTKPLIEDHVLIIWHDVFSGLPWTTFWPDFRSVALMMTILNCGKSECLTFLGGMFVQIGWPQVLRHIVEQESRSLVVYRTLDSLLHLYISLALHMDTSRGDEMSKLLESAHTHPWELIDSKSYENAMRRFLSKCHPQCVLLEQDLKESCILNLLQTVAEFVPGTNRINAEAPTKRVTFVRSCIHLLCECASKNKTLIRTRMELFKDVILSLIKHTEVVLVTGSNQDRLFEDGVTIVTEILNVLNIASVGCLQDLAIKAFQDWAKANPRSPIFGAVLHATSRTLALVSHMTILIETLVESYFSIDVDLCIAGNGWSFLLSVIEIPQLNEDSLIDECLNSGHYLTLKCVSGLLLMNCKSLEEECAVLSRVIDWLDKSKPTEENEHKLLLLWWIFLEGVIRIRNSITSAEQLKLLTDFSSAIQPLGDDKASQGFWATLGLGKKSPLSQKFRFVTRCINAFILVRAKRLEFNDKDNPLLMKQVQSALSLLESTKTARNYVEYRDHMDRVFDYVQGESRSLRDASSLLSYLSRIMYPDKHCLTVIFN